MRRPSSIDSIFVEEERWSDTYSAGLALFPLHCNLVPERTHWLSAYSCYVINTRHLVWRVLFLFCLGFEKHQETKHFYGDQLWKSISFPSFVSCLSQTYLGRFLRTILGHLGCLHFMKWFDPWWVTDTHFRVSLWTCSSPLGQHKPERVVHISSIRYFPHYVLICKQTAQFMNIHIHDLSCPKF